MDEMITFIWAEALWLLLLIPLLILGYLWLLRRKKKTAVRYANLAMVRQAMGTGGAWRRHVPPILMLIAVTILILAVARPAAVMTLASSRGTIILAMDVSGSMRATDVEPTRLEAAQEAAKQFITSQPANVQIGIVAFAASGVLVQVPTIDREALTAAIDRFQLRRGTAVGSGVLVSLATIFPDQQFELPDMASPWQAQRPGNSRSLDTLGQRQDTPEHIPVEPGSYQSAVIILLTDGATTTGPDPRAAGQMAADYGVRVFTVGLGSPEGSAVDFGGRRMRAQLDAPTLQAIAETTRGEYFAATSSDDLEQVYGSLTTQLVAEKKLTEIAFIFAGIGAIFALLAGGLSLAWFGRLT